MPTKLSNADVTAALAGLPGWAVDGDAIAKTYAFADYYRVMAFVNAVAFVAHARDHHPDMAVGYNRVTVRFGTHDAGGVTHLDVTCAGLVDALRP